MGSRSRTVRSVVAGLAAGLLAASGGAAGAEEVAPVDIVDVTFDRFGTIVGGGALVAVWITCDATGVIGDLSVTVAQRGASATTNSDLLDARCTTTPTRYALRLESFGDELKPGRAEISEATEHPSGQSFGDGQTIILRPART